MPTIPISSRKLKISPDELFRQLRKGGLIKFSSIVMKETIFFNVLNYPIQISFNLPEIQIFLSKIFCAPYICNNDICKVVIIILMFFAMIL